MFIWVVLRFCNKKIYNLSNTNVLKQQLLGKLNLPNALHQWYKEFTTQYNNTQLAIKAISKCFCLLISLCSYCSFLVYKEPTFFNEDIVVVCSIMPSKV